MSLLIILLLVGIAGPLIWLSYERGRSAAIADANGQMAALTEKTMDRYRLLFADAVPILNVLFSTKIMTSRAVRDVAAQYFVFRALGLHQAKGREEKVEIFELAGVPET